MSSYITQTRTIRIKNETAEYFKGKAMNRAVDSMCAMIERGELEFDGENLRVVGGVHTGKCSDKKSVFGSEKGKDLEEMLKCCEKSANEFADDVHDLMENGELVYEKGVLKVDVGLDVESFRAWCRSKNANPKIVFDNILKEIGAK